MKILILLLFPLHLISQSDSISYSILNDSTYVKYVFSINSNGNKVVTYTEFSKDDLAEELHNSVQKNLRRVYELNTKIKKHNIQKKETLAFMKSLHIDYDSLSTTKLLPLFIGKWVFYGDGFDKEVVMIQTHKNKTNLARVISNTKSFNAKLISPYNIVFLNAKGIKKIDFFMSGKRFVGRHGNKKFYIKKIKWNI